MHKNIGAAVIGRDKAISAICVEEFDPPTWHAQLIRSQRTAPRPAPKESNGDGPGLGTRAELFGTKRVMPERVILQKRLAASNAAGRLIHCFDRISVELIALSRSRPRSVAFDLKKASACSRLSHSVIATRLGGGRPSKPTTFPPPVRKLRPPTFACAAWMRCATPEAV